jgi:fructose-1-phosphate kinase PfkB-like protein
VVSGPGTEGPRGRLLFVAANVSMDRLYELDRLVAGEIHRPQAIVVVPGGKGLNAARAAAALGGSVTAIGIDARMVRARGEARTCISILDRSSGALTEIYERGEEIEPAAWDALVNGARTTANRSCTASAPKRLRTPRRWERVEPGRPLKRQVVLQQVVIPF